MADLPTVSTSDIQAMQLNAQAVPPAPALSGGTPAVGIALVSLTYLSPLISGGVPVTGFLIEGLAGPTATPANFDGWTVTSPPAPSSPAGAIATAYNVYSSSNQTGVQLQNLAPIPLGTDFTIGTYQGFSATPGPPSQAILTVDLEPTIAIRAQGADAYSATAAGGNASVSGTAVGNGLGLGFNPLGGQIGATDPTIVELAGFPVPPAPELALSAYLLWSGFAKQGATRLCEPNADPCDNVLYVVSEPRGLIAIGDTLRTGAAPPSDTFTDAQVLVNVADVPFLRGIWWWQQPSPVVCHCGADDSTDSLGIQNFRVGIVYSLARALGVGGESIFPPPPEPLVMQLLPYLYIPKGQGQDISELDGHSSVAQIDIETIDLRGELKRMAADPTAIGRITHLKQGFPGMCLGDFVTLHTMQLTEVNWTGEGRMAFVNQDIQRFLDDRYILLNGGPDPFIDGLVNSQPVGDKWTQNDTAVDDKNPRFLQGNPMDLYLAVLQNECGVGQATTDPITWRIFVPGDDSTLIYPNQFIDVPSVIILRDTEFSGDRMEFKITRSVQAKNWLDDQILKPLGLYTIVRADGRLYLKTMKSPQDVTAAVVIDQHGISGIPKIQRLPIVNYLTVRMEVDDGVRETSARQYNVEYTFQQQQSIQRYNQYYEDEVESSGLRVNYGGYSRAFLLAQRVFARHAFATPQYDFDAFLKFVPVELGDYFLLTHPLLLDLVSGTLGVTNVLCEVVDRQPDYSSGKMSYSVLDGRFLGLSTPHDIVPASAAVPVYGSATDDQKTAYFFISATNGTYSDSTAGDGIF